MNQVKKFHEYDHPNEFTFYIEQSIFEQNVVNHQSWRNRRHHSLAPFIYVNHYPELDMPFVTFLTLMP